MIASLELRFSLNIDYDKKKFANSSGKKPLLSNRSPIEEVANGEVEGGLANTAITNKDKFELRNFCLESLL